VLAFLETGEKVEPEDSRWKALQYEFLVALDRRKTSPINLRLDRGDDADNGWRLSWAISTPNRPDSRRHAALRAVRAADELGPAESAPCRLVHGR